MAGTSPRNPRYKRFGNSHYPSHYENMASGCGKLRSKLVYLSGSKEYLFSRFMFGTAEIAGDTPDGLPKINEAPQPATGARHPIARNIPPERMADILTAMLQQHEEDSAKAFKRAQHEFFAANRFSKQEQINFLEELCHSGDPDLANEAEFLLGKMQAEMATDHATPSDQEAQAALEGARKHAEAWTGIKEALVRVLSVKKSA